MTIKEVGKLLEISNTYGVSVTELGNAFSQLAKELGYDRQENLEACVDKFRTKSEEVKFEEIS